MQRRSLLIYLGSLPLACGIAAAADERPLLVFAAASLADALEDAGAAYTAATGRPVRFSFASSGILARQLEAGAEADVLFPADTEWMDYADARDLVDRRTRVDLLTNRLVLIAPADGDAKRIELRAGVDLVGALDGGRLAVGDPESVPAGRYAQAALTSLGVWTSVRDGLVRADNVRAALAFVARGEAPLGIVYETDARAEARVAVVGAFPPETHPPIVYPVAATTHAHEGGAGFVTFLRSRESQAIFERYGFSVIGEGSD